MPDPAPLIVFSDDWGRHPSSCQHLISKLLPHRRVVWVNTIGTRPPGLNWSTVTRGMGKLRQWVRGQPTPPSPLPEGKGEKELPTDAVSNPAESRASSPFPDRRGLQGETVRGSLSQGARGGGGVGSSPLSPLVLNPKMWPSFRSRFARGLNRRLLTRALKPVADALPEPLVVVTTIPLVADLVGGFRAARWVYYCVDDFSVWPGLDGHTMRDMEAELVPKMNLTIAVSEPLQTHLARWGKTAHVLTHGVDLDFWRAPQPGEVPTSLRELATMPEPLVVYWGVIDRRTDRAFVKHLGEAMTAGTILFAGPHDAPDPELLRLPRVRSLPPIPFADLPALAARASVLIAPYADLPVTRAMQPLKLKEYIATAKPVVVRRLPATAEWANCVDVVESPEAFARAVLMRAQTGVPEDQRQARVRLANEEWSAKADQFARWIDGEQ